MDDDDGLIRLELQDLGHDDGICAAIAMTDRLCTGGCDNRLLLWRGEQRQDGVHLSDPQGLLRVLVSFSALAIELDKDIL